MKKVILIITILVFNSHSNSQGWQELFYGPGQPYNSVFFIDANTGWICSGQSIGQGYTGSILKTFNGGTNWLVTFSDSINFYSIYFINSLTGFITGLKRTNSVYSVNILKSTDGGLSFFNVHAEPNSFQPIKVQFQGLGRGYVFLSNNVLLRSTNTGINWQPVVTGPNSIADGIFTSTDTGYIANTFNTVLKTNNGGLNWFQVYAAGKIFWKSISFANTLTGWVTDGSSLRKTTNGGQSWNYLNGGSNRFINFVNASVGWSCGIIQSAYISRTTNGGENWHQQTLLYNNLYFTKLFFLNETTGWAAGYRYINPNYFSILLKTTNGGFTFAEPVSNETPDKFSLSQNYPNPFNPVTSIEFSTPKSGYVNITIYDALGNTVEVLQNGELKPGTYKAEWNASEYPSGIYFYRLTAGDFSQTKKMVLAK